MYNCPNCGGHIRYDIPSAKIHCDSCDSSFDPYELDKKQGEGKDAEEQKTYETTLFTCPHCGGEITSTDVTAASFCTYCGSPVVLGSRISREKRPALIIPFMKTKEECKEAYRRKMRQAFFVPKELQDPEYLEKFRGIYIPYWLFDVQFHGVSSIMGSKEHREGDYIVRTEYELRGDLDAAYPNIYYDASSSFDDSIGETIAPYESENLRPFTPSMLCGFFADTSDVESSVYKGDAETFARQEAALALSKQPAYRNFSPGSRQPFRVDAEMQKARLSMFPVWFLTWRKDDRVAYAIANGLTGKISADLPIDYGKYTVFSILTAVPIFLLLNLFLTVSAAHTLLVTSFLGLFSLILYQRQLGIIRDRKEHTYDKGYQTLQNEYGLTQDAVAKTVGRSRPAVANAMRLLSLSEPVRELVETGMLSAGHARTLLALEKAKTAVKKEKVPTVDYLGECARDLEQALGRRVRMTQGRKGGRIELEYYDADDREALLQALKQLPKLTRKYEK